MEGEIEGGNKREKETPGERQGGRKRQRIKETGGGGGGEGQGRQGEEGKTVKETGR